MPNCSGSKGLQIERLKVESLSRIGGFSFSQSINVKNTAENGRVVNRLAEYGNVVVILSIKGNEEKTDTWCGSESARSEAIWS
jgi:hypothetical protein